ncbi:MAG: hypothetical protein WCO06_01380 [Candidatus Roizmanbacteria bacterium]
MNKPIKVLWNGKLLREIYPHATRWQVFKFKLKKFVRKCLIVSGVMTMAFILIVLGVYVNPAIKCQKKIAEKDNLTLKVNDIKDKVINDIQSCESKGHSESDGIIIFDSNKVASVGTMQFQVKTVQHYYKTLYDQEITPKEAILIALDDNKAEALAKDIIFKDSKGWRNWFNCGTKNGTEVKLKVINELLQ